MIKDIKEINFSIDGTAEFNKKNKLKNVISYEQLIVKLFISVLKPRLKSSSHRDLREIQLQKRYQPRDYVWFSFEKYYKSLYNFIWTQFANFIQERGKLKRCEKCQKYFISKVVGRGRFCSDVCRASRGREIEIWQLVKNEFKKKGYETFMTEKSHYSRLRVGLRADAALYNEKSKEMVALLEFKYSDINNKSPKFKFIANNIIKELELYHKYFGLNHAFVVNKNKNIFFWDLEKKIYGDQIKDIPSAYKLQSSTYKIDKKIEKEFFIALEQDRQKK